MRRHRGASLWATAAARSLDWREMRSAIRQAWQRSVRTCRGNDRGLVDAGTSIFRPAQASTNGTSGDHYPEISSPPGGRPATTNGTSAVRLAAVSRPPHSHLASMRSPRPAGQGSSISHRWRSAKCRRAPEGLRRSERPLAAQTQSKSLYCCAFFSKSFTAARMGANGPN
jgi:hypothetical protein